MTPDVLVVGGSIAGCTAARLYADAGAEVVVLEKHGKPDAHKVMCTTFIQPSATPVIERIGLAPALEAAGANRNHGNFWTRWGWIRPEIPEDWPHARHGYNVSRRTLDPALRSLVAETPGVDVRLGAAAQELVWEGGRVAGVVARTRDGAREELRAPLVVAADGRGSGMARMAGVPGRVRPNARFCYFAFFSGVELATPGVSQMWFLEPDMAYTFPMEDGLTLLCAVPEQRRKDEFRADPDGAVLRYFEDLPEGPDLSRAERVGKTVGKLDLTNVSRPAAAKGMAFVGDAALAADPLWGVGCGWAFQSAEWLADATAGALYDRGALDRGLDAYRRRHRRKLGPHHFMINDYSTGRDFAPFEKLLYRAAAHDRKTALTLHRMGARHQSPGVLFTPRALARMAKVNLREALPV